MCLPGVDRMNKFSLRRFDTLGRALVGEAKTGAAEDVEEDLGGARRRFRLLWLIYRFSSHCSLEWFLSSLFPGQSSKPG